MKKKMAIIGAGFCGLAAAWHLSDHYSITLFDKVPIGESTSGMASGLLHPFAGAHSKLNWRGQEGYLATLQLLEIASKTIGKSVISPKRGILRLATTLDQISDYQLCAEAHSDEVQWLNEEQTQGIIPGIYEAPGIWIKNGLTVYSSLYLQGLWQACKEKGVELEQKTISMLSELDDYDLTLVASGAASTEFQELSDLHLTKLKGQLLELKWPDHLKPLPCALNSHVYLLMSESNTSCIVGGTFERHYTTPYPDLEVAKDKLLPKLIAMYPALESAPILACRSGFRSVTPNHLPLIKQIGPKRWVIAGMGSKGLLYHALMAKELSQKLFCNA